MISMNELKIICMIKTKFFDILLVQNTAKILDYYDVEVVSTNKIKTA